MAKGRPPAPRLAVSGGAFKQDRCLVTCICARFDNPPAGDNAPLLTRAFQPRYVVRLSSAAIKTMGSTNGLGSQAPRSREKP